MPPDWPTATDQLVTRYDGLYDSWFSIGTARVCRFLDDVDYSNQIRDFQ
jgi:hypothetical protein